LISILALRCSTPLKPRTLVFFVDNRRLYSFAILFKLKTALCKFYSEFARTIWSSANSNMTMI
jgi:hypothetical protein